MLSNHRILVGGSVATAVVMAVALSAKYWWNSRPEKTQTNDHRSDQSRSYFLDQVPKTNKDLVGQLKYLNHITNDRLESAMLTVDRSNFVDAENPFVNSELPIGFQATISAPDITCISLDILACKIEPGSTVLDVGSGSGYTSAIFAEMVGEKGRVVGIDHISELVETALINIKKSNSNLLSRIKFVVGDGRLGHRESAPYDIIYVSASLSELPKILLSQLKPGGRMIIPVGPSDGYQQLQQVDASEDGSDFVVKGLGNFKFSPLTEDLNSKQSTRIANVNVPIKIQMIPAPDLQPTNLRIMRKDLGIEVST